MTITTGQKDMFPDTKAEAKNTGGITIRGQKGEPQHKENISTKCETTDGIPPQREPRSTMGGKPVFFVPSKSVINWDSGFKHKHLCDGPTLSMGSACQFACAYCFVPDMMRKLRELPGYAHVEGKHEDIVIRRENAIEVLKAQLASAKGRRMAEQKLTIYASPLVDVASNMELAQETVQACIQILWHTNWDIRLLSKSNLLPKVAQALDDWSQSNGCRAKQRVIYGVSTGTLDNNLARAIEAGTPLVSKRIESLHWLQDHGYRTFGMICPSLPQSDYEQFAREMAAAIRADKCEHVWAEVLNARGESFTRTLFGLREAGYNEDADRFCAVAGNKEQWELYARSTFEAHARALPTGKLRFLQYVSAGTRDWWASQAERGAVLL